MRAPSMGRSADSGRKSAWEHRSGLAGGWLAGEATPAVAGAVGAVVATTATVAWSAIAFALPGFLLVVLRATNAPLCAVGSPDRVAAPFDGMPGAWRAGTRVGECGIIMALVSVDSSTPLDEMIHRKEALVVKRSKGGTGARIGGILSISDGQDLTGKYRGRTSFVQYLMLEKHGKGVVEGEICDCVIRG
ncbi:hypothetical protein PC123_g25323 [Phytophthora cactorum]|nr:hypothetical protein PC123_g25323 [Phytophthora cactorum]